MAVKQQFIIEVTDAKVLDEIEGDPETPSLVSILIPNREAAEALYADLRLALGYSGSGSKFPTAAPYVPTQVEQGAVRADSDDMSTWSAEELAAFFASEPDEEELELADEDPPVDEEAAAAAKQALSRRELQRQDPANAAAFQPHVAATVPPSQKRGSAIGATHLNLPPEQAY